MKYPSSVITFHIPQKAKNASNFVAIIKDVFTSDGAGICPEVAGADKRLEHKTYSHTSLL